MKRITVIGVALLCGIQLSHADKIITRKADIIDCKVNKISDTAIKYRIFGEQFECEINKNDVFKIKYDNGEEESFTQSMSIAQNSTILSRPQIEKYPGISTTFDWNSLPPTTQRYNIGDWFSERGIEGVVIYTTNDGRHGFVINTKTIKSRIKQFPWFTGPTNFPLGMNDTNNGYANLQVYKEFIRNHSEYGPEMFPMMERLKSEFENGWFVPSVNEAKYYMDLCDKRILYKGNNPKFKGKATNWGKIFKSVSKSHGGDSLNEYILMTSTELYSEGGASVTFEKMYGDPHLPQYAFYKVEYKLNELVLIPTIRNKYSFFIFLFHHF